MCGITVLPLADRKLMASPELFEGLGMLQHRGQDAAGIVTSGNKGRLYQIKGSGMVRDVFDLPKLEQLVGNMGVDHVRYPTPGNSSSSEAQPFYVNSPYGITFAHNGNLVNAEELRVFLDQDAHRHINTDSDSGLLLNIFTNNLQKTGKSRINEEDIFTAIKGTCDMARDAGAKKVYLASCAPEIRFPNVYGIDMPSPHELVAYNKTEDQIAQAIGADKVVFQDLAGLISSCQKFNPSIASWDASVFDGKYVTGKVDQT